MRPFLAALLCFGCLAAHGGERASIAKDPLTNKYTVRFAWNGRWDSFSFYAADQVRASWRTSLTLRAGSVEYRYRVTNSGDSPEYLGEVDVPCPGSVSQLPGMKVGIGPLKRPSKVASAEQYCQCVPVIRPGTTAASDCAFSTAMSPGIVMGLFSGVPMYPMLDAEEGDFSEALELFRSVAFTSAPKPMIGPRFAPGAFVLSKSAGVLASEWDAACKNGMVSNAGTCATGKKQLQQLMGSQGESLRKGLADFLAWLKSSDKSIDAAFAQALEIDGRLSLEAKE